MQQRIYSEECRLGREKRNIIGGKRGRESYGKSTGVSWRAAGFSMWEVVEPGNGIRPYRVYKEPDMALIRIYRKIHS